MERIAIQLLIAMVVFLAGGWFGYDYRNKAVAQERVAAVDKAVKDANIKSEAERELAVSAAIDEQRREHSVREKKLLAQQNAAKEASLSCKRSVASLRVLVNLIDAANGQAGPTGSMPEGMRANPEASGRK